MPRSKTTCCGLNRPVIVDLWAERCMPCRLVAALEKIAEIDLGARPKPAIMDQIVEFFR
jgi:hypothetical protein